MIRGTGLHPWRVGVSIVVSLVAALLSALPGTAGAHVFGLVDTGELYRSTNGGVTWAGHATLAVRDAVGVAASATVNDLTIVTRTGSVYRSTNGGATWAAVGTITASDIVSFTILPNASILALTETGTLYRSTNGGVSFSGFAALTGSNWVSLTRGPQGRLFAVTRTGEIFRSTDQGATWIPIAALTVSNAVSIQRTGLNLFVLTETGEVYRGGETGSWLPVGAITASNMSALVSSGSTILAAARSGEVYQSTTGASWTPVGAVNQLNVVSIGSDQPLATGVEVEETAPRAVVGAPYPNPSSRGAGTFPVLLDRPGRVTLELYDVHGRLLAAREGVSLGAGSHAVGWAPQGVRSGRYLVRYLVDGRRVAASPWTLVR